MIDAGLDLESDNAEVVRRLGSLPPEMWNSADRERLRGGQALTSRGIPLKRIYGSAFPYRSAGDVSLVEESAEIGAVPSYARGGFSNVWGAGVLPYADDELADWPISREDLTPHFKAVLEAMPLAGERDRLTDAFPLYTERLNSLDVSRQAAALLEDLERGGVELERNGFVFGRSRLAVRSHPAGDDLGCVRCGLCLYGCPYKLIYNAASTLDSLIAEEPKFRYVPGVVVHRVREASDTVTIEGRDLAGAQRSFIGSRVFLACGAFSTTRVVLESMGAYDTPVRFIDSQYFLLPLLRYAAVPGVASENLHTMCQIFLRLRRPEFGERAMHLSVYTYNDLYRRVIERMLGTASPLVGALMTPLLSRLLVIQGHLPSNLSAGITATLVQGRSGGPATLRLATWDTDRPEKILKRAWREIFRARRLLRAVPALLRKGKPGRGFYAGGSLPMSRTPGRFEADALGRPSGFERTHMVDASVFPSIAGTPITFTVMANAHRIASEADQSL